MKSHITIFKNRMQKAATKSYDFQNCSNFVLFRTFQVGKDVFGFGAVCCVLSRSQDAGCGGGGEKNSITFLPKIRIQIEY